MSAMAQCHLRRRNFNDRPFISGDSDIIRKIGNSGAMKTGIVKRYGEGEDVVEIKFSVSGSNWYFYHDQNLFWLPRIQDVCRMVVITCLFMYYFEIRMICLQRIVYRL